MLVSKVVLLQENAAMNAALDKHEGCNIHGWLEVQRVAGNFHLSVHADHYFAMRSVRSPSVSVCPVPIAVFQGPPGCSLYLDVIMLLAVAVILRWTPVQAACCVQSASGCQPTSVSTPTLVHCAKPATSALADTRGAREAVEGADGFS